MSSRGYGFESEIEDFLLKFEGQNKQTPLLRFDERGMLYINRSFRVMASGALACLKGDVISAVRWLPRQLKIECKARFEHTKKDGPIIVVEKEWITKNEQEALADNQIPVLTFSFKRVHEHRVWWIIKIDDFDYMNNFNGKSALSCATTAIQGLTTSKKTSNLKFIYQKLIFQASPILSSVDCLQCFPCEGSYYLMSHKLFHSLLLGRKKYYEESKGQVL